MPEHDGNLRSSPGKREHDAVRELVVKVVRERPLQLQDFRKAKGCSSRTGIGPNLGASNKSNGLRGAGRTTAQVCGAAASSLEAYLVRTSP